VRRRVAIGKACCWCRFKGQEGLLLSALALSLLTEHEDEDEDDGQEVESEAKAR
jgi:hypothetical protein